MPRPRLCRKVNFHPDVTYFKPQGIPMRELETVELSLEEMEALRLRHMEGLEQIQAADKMQTSQSTYHRILGAACRKIADALIHGKALAINTKK